MLFLGYGIVSGLVIAVILSISKVGKSGVMFPSIMGGLFFGFIGWLLMPVINLWFPGFWIFVFVILVTAVVIAFFYNDEVQTTTKVILFGLLLWVIVLFFTTSPALQSMKYRGLMTTPTESIFIEDVSPVDINRVRQVDENLAMLLAEKKLGEMPGLGSRAEVGEMYVQIINGRFNILDGRGQEHRLELHNELFWAGPLIHSGVFKQLSHGTTPGYVLVSATDPSKVYLVNAIKSPAENSDTEQVPRMGNTPEGFQDISLQFMTRAYFGSNLKRHLRQNGYLSRGITDFTFEIRDDGMPFYVATEFVKTVGFSGNEAVGTIIVDPQTGDIQRYSTKNTPLWVDRIQPEDFVVSQLDWQGKYVKGWWNSFLGRENVRMTTPGMSLVYGADGRAYWYTGIQSAGADEATMGFMLVDTRTKESRWYQISGATEKAVERVAESAPGVREAEYQSTNPILYNVNGNPTYFMTLKGDDGLVKMFALVNVQNYQIVGVGSSINSALRDYRKALIEDGQSLSADDLVTEKVIEGIVKKVTWEDGFYYFLLEGEENKGKEFEASAVLSSELKWTEPGDRVIMGIQEGEEKTIPIVSFSNLDF
jgi:hypothetical protein